MSEIVHREIIMLSYTPFFFNASMRQTYCTWHGKILPRGRITISSSLRRRLIWCKARTRMREVTREYTRSRFSCLLAPFLNSRLRRQARCVSRRCVFRIVAPDRIIFFTGTFTRSTFGLQRNRNVMRETIKQVFQPVIFENAPLCVGPRNRIRIFTFRLSTDFHVFISDSVSWRFPLRSTLLRKEQCIIITKFLRSKCCTGELKQLAFLIRIQWIEIVYERCMKAKDWVQMRNGEISNEKANVNLFTLQVCLLTYLIVSHQRKREKSLKKRKRKRKE